MSTGTGLYTDTRGLIPVHSLFDRWYKEQHNILMLVYCLTGSDRARSFNGKRKKTVFETFFENAYSYFLQITLATKHIRNGKSTLDFEVSHYGNQTLPDYQALANKIVRHTSMGVPHEKNCTISYICCTERCCT